jgi:phosphatidylserine decarboxylase
MLPMSDKTSTKQETILDTTLKTIPPINPEGWKFIAIFAAITAFMGLFSTFLFWMGVVATVWCAYFFRDPIRTVPTREGLVVSPADGVVQTIVSVVPPEQLNLGTNERIRISVFLNVFNVHVNRIPAQSTVTGLNYFPGAFFNASLDKASEENERQHITLSLTGGKTMGVVQIAGFVARRILCQLKLGDTLATGQRFGLIRFGSRVDTYLPEGATPLVVVGQVAIGGETVFADLKSSETTREGVKI